MAEVIVIHGATKLGGISKEERRRSDETNESTKKHIVGLHST